MWARFLLTRTGGLVIAGVILVGIGLASEGVFALVGAVGVGLVILGILLRIDALEGVHHRHLARHDQRLAAIDERVERSRDRIDRLTGLHGSGHERDIDVAGLRELIEYWNPRLGTEATVGSFLSVSHRVRSFEAIAVGRIATTIADVLIRCLVAEAAGGDEVELCEVGTLFGIGGLVVLDHALARSRNAHLTVIDPLSGFYGKDALDPSTALPVTRSNLERNVRLFGVGEQHLRIIEGLSTDDAVLTATSDREYDVMIYDGDHSYEGIRQDHERYSGLVRTGGFLVIDDYGTDLWPDVTRYTDDVIASDERFEFVGAGSRTAVYRRRLGSE